MTDVRALLRRTADLASDFLESLDDRPIFPTASATALREALGGTLGESPTDPHDVVAQLAAAADPGLVAMPSGRYFGFVIGGALPAALAADWLTSAWDQNAGLCMPRCAHSGGVGSPSSSSAPADPGRHPRSARPGRLGPGVLACTTH